MDDDHKIVPAFEILKAHKITPYVSSIFGSTVGCFMDHGMTDLEILTVTEEFCKAIRSAVQDHRVISHLRAEAETLRPHFENPIE